MVLILYTTSSYPNAPVKYYVPIQMIRLQPQPSSSPSFGYLLVSGIVASAKCPLCGSSSVLVRPILNSATQRLMAVCGEDFPKVELSLLFISFAYKPFK